MSLDRTDFGAFFAAVHDGFSPFRWQWRLLDQILDTGRWPDQLVAPTGAGKTSVIDVHVFAVALMAAGHPVRVPRRLALVVDRRALVDDQFTHAEMVAEHLAGARGDAGIAGEVATALDSLRWNGAEPKSQPRPSPLRTERLRGGAPPPLAWRDDPLACLVLCATPDMWGSRVLLGGYGSRPEARPREAGLLAFDTVVVVDEAHLSQQLVTTARRVAELTPVATEPLAVPVLQVVETTATQIADAGVAVGVEAGDFEVDAPLKQRLTTPKPVRLLPLPAWPFPRSGGTRSAGIRAFADEAVRLRQKYGPTVGCFVNSVEVAAAVSAELRSRELQTELVCGRLRPFDLQDLRRRRGDLLSIKGNAEVDVLVTTQSLEVGVDLDLSAAVTELAPGGALAQRAGRVNRLGLRRTEVSVVVPAADLPDQAWSGPYGREDLVAAHGWLVERQRDPDGLAPWALRELQRPPMPAQRRDVLQRLELAETWHLARTNDDLAATPDELDFWLADDLDNADHDIGLVVRHALPVDPADAARLVQDLPPREYEVFPVPIRQTATIRERLKPEPAPVLVRPGEQPRSWGEHERLRPGDQLVVDDTARLFTSGVFGTTGDEPVNDVLGMLTRPDQERSDSQEDRLVEVVVRIDRETHADLLDAVSLAIGSSDDTTGAVARVLREHHAALADGPMARAADLLDPLAEQTDTLPAKAEVILHRSLDADDDPPLVRMIVVDLRKAFEDADLRQTWTPRRRRVPLQKHSEAVEERARRIAERLHLGRELVNDLALAGKHHDDGKRDQRFQRSLGVDPATTETMAKSGVSHPQRVRQLRTTSGLPTGWRHEQLSVLRAWHSLSILDVDRRDLVARLIGTSHGRGRSSFPHASTQLVERPDETAAELFEEGGWDALIERTHDRWGVWGCAYLEALLRAADGQVSAEGS